VIEGASEGLAEGSREGLPLGKCDGIELGSELGSELGKGADDGIWMQRVLASTSATLLAKGITPPTFFPPSDCAKRMLVTPERAVWSMHTSVPFPA